MPTRGEPAFVGRFVPVHDGARVVRGTARVDPSATRRRRRPPDDDEGLGLERAVPV